MACTGRTYDPKLGVEAVMLGKLLPPFFVPEVAAAGAGVALGLGTPDQGSTSGMYEAVEDASGSKSDEVNVDWNAVGRFRGALNMMDQNRDRCCASLVCSSGGEEMQAKSAARFRFVCLTDDRYPPQCGLSTRC